MYNVLGNIDIPWEKGVIIKYMLSIIQWYNKMDKRENANMMRNVLSCVIIGSLLIGCGQTISDEEDISETIESTTEGQDTEGNEVAEESVGEYHTEWGRAYWDYINNMEVGSDDSNREETLNTWDYTLIYLDDDDIPELMIDTNMEAGGELIATYYDGEVVDYVLSRIGTKYIPETGLLYTDTGHMDEYPVFITKLENGQFTQLAEGVYYLSDEERERLANVDESWEDSVNYTYEWEGKEVTKEEFNSNIASYLDVDLLERPDDYYQLGEIRAMLQTGKWSSYGHRYELVKGNVSWQEAFDEAQAKGGYLATITCNEELEVVQELIEKENMTDSSFYVAFRKCEWDGDKFLNDRWVLPSGETVNTYSSYDYEYRNDPDYDSSFKETEWDVYDGKAGLLMYGSSGLYLYFAPDDIAESVPKYKDHVGYVIEYDE